MSGRADSRRRGRALTTPIFFLLLFPALVGAAPRVEFILDLSASMSESVGGVRGEELARTALREAVRVLPPEVEVGVRVFGHRVAHGDKAASCADSELIIPFRTGLSAADLTVLDRLAPRGLTPLARVLKESAGDFTATGNDRAVILITDGADTCDGDPVGVVRDLRTRGFRVALHIIGLRTTPTVHAELAAIAQLGGGRFSSVGDLSAMRRGVFGALKASLSSLHSLDVDGMGDLDTPFDGGDDLSSATPLEAGREFARNHVRGHEDPADVFVFESRKGEKYHGVVRFIDRFAGGKLTVLAGTGEVRAPVAGAEEELSFDILDVERDESVFVRITSDRPSGYVITLTRLVGLP